MNTWGGVYKGTMCAQLSQVSESIYYVTVNHTLHLGWQLSYICAGQTNSETNNKLMHSLIFFTVHRFYKF